MAKVSVIIPVYNQGEFVGKTIESVLSQAYKDFELIVVDDCSTDDTPRIVKTYLPKLTFFRLRKNSGVSVAINTGIKKAKGKYMLFLCSDDCILPRFLEKAVAVLEKYPNVGLVHAPVRFMNMQEKIIGKQRIGKGYFEKPNAYASLIVHNFVRFETALARGSIVKKVGLFHPKLVEFEDWDMWLKIARVAKIAYIPQHLGVYRINKNGMTATFWHNFERIGAERGIVVKETIGKDIPNELKIWTPLLFLDTTLRGESLPKPIAKIVMAFSLGVSIATSRLLRIFYR